MPEDMASKLSVLIILPAIMAACSAFSIVSSALIMLIIFMGNLKKRKIEEEEKKEDTSLSKDIQYFSSLPVTEKDMIVNENLANSETENSRQKCMTVELST